MNLYYSNDPQVVLWHNHIQIWSHWAFRQLGHSHRGMPWLRNNIPILSFFAWECPQLFLLYYFCSRWKLQNSFNHLDVKILYLEPFGGHEFQSTYSILRACAQLCLFRVIPTCTTPQANLALKLCSCIWCLSDKLWSQEVKDC